MYAQLPSGEVPAGGSGRVGQILNDGRLAPHQDNFQAIFVAVQSQEPSP
jgi:hypothetical protein